MKEGKGKILVVVLTIMVIVLGGLNVYQYLNKKDNVANDNNSNVSENSGNYLTLVEGHQVKVESNDAKVLRTSGTNNNYVLYRDNGFKIYEIQTGKVSKINLDVEDGDDTYYVFTSNGFVYRDLKHDLNGFYNFETDTVTLKNKYIDLYPIDDEYGRATDYLKAWNKEGMYVINSRTGEVIITHKYSNSQSSDCEDECYSRDFRVETSGWFAEYIIAYWYSEGTGGGYNEYGYTIYDEEGKRIAELEDDETYNIKNWDSLVIYKKEKSIPLF